MEQNSKESKVSEEKFITCQPRGGRCNICGKIYAYNQDACELGHVEGVVYSIGKK